MPFFNRTFGQPAKELYAAIGIQVLQQTFDLQTKKRFNNFPTNIQWHYTLNITEESNYSKYISLKTLRSMRHLIAEHVC